MVVCRAVCLVVLADLSADSVGSCVIYCGEFRKAGEVLRFDEVVCCSEAG